MRKLLSLLLAVVLCVAPLAGCGGGGSTGGGTGGGGGSGGKKTTIVMLSTGDAAQKAEYRAMRDAFNNSEYARQNGLWLNNTFHDPDSYSQLINQGTCSDNAAHVDIVFVNDKQFKNWAYQDWIIPLEQYMSEGFEDYMYDSMWDSIHPRFRLNKNGFTSYEDDDYWGVPIDTSPTALYYNRDALENAGVIVISVDDDVVPSHRVGCTTTTNTIDPDCKYCTFAKEYEGLNESMIGQDLLDLWNQNRIADKFGQYHNTCGNRKWEPGKGNLADNATGAGYAADVLVTRNITVPKKGYYREDSNNNWVRAMDTTWRSPNYGLTSGGESVVTLNVKVFNASIAMNWDEMEDIARLLSLSQNKQEATHNRNNAATVYGYFTQWWFNYGWGVGGDCLLDTTNEGTWMYGLADWSANYKVTAAGAGYVGKGTGTVYQEGDTLLFLDKLNVDPYDYKRDANGNAIRNPVTGQYEFEGDIILPNATGGIDIYDPVTKTATPLAESPSSRTSNATIDPDIIANSTTDLTVNPNAMFVELPSTKEAVCSYLDLVDSPSESLGIMPRSELYGPGYDDEGPRSIAAFCNGDIAFIVERGYQIGTVRDYANGVFEWGIAPLPQYKEYLDPKSDNVAVKRQGVEGGHSEATALCITKESKYPQLAMQVIEWMTSDYITLADGTKERAGQIVKAEEGYIPNQPDIANSSTFIKSGEETLNLDIFFDALDYEKAGDWWYLKNEGWIGAWSSGLNDDVRNGEITADVWYQQTTWDSNKAMVTGDFSYYFGRNTELQLAWDQRFRQS